MKLSLSASLEALGVQVEDDLERGATRFTEPCPWCRHPIVTVIDDADLRKLEPRAWSRVVVRALADSRTQHLATAMCAAAGP